MKNFKLWCSLALAASIVVGGYFYFKPKKYDRIKYYNPDHEIELNQDKQANANYNKAMIIFDKLLNNEVDVSRDDIAFLADFLVNVGKINSDYQTNHTHIRMSLLSELVSKYGNGNQFTKDILKDFQDAYNNTYFSGNDDGVYHFNEKGAYKFMIYINSLWRDRVDTLDQYSNREVNMIYSSHYHESFPVATKSEYGKRHQLPPMVKLVMLSLSKGFLNGDYTFKYKRDLKESPYYLVNYNNAEYNAFFDQMINNVINEMDNENKNVLRSRR